MISRQQLRLLTLFMLAFGLLTVPVILILINLVPVEDANTMSAEVIPSELATDSQVMIAPAVDASLEIEQANNIIASKTENHEIIKATDRISNTPMQRSYIAGNWVVVDCGQRSVVQCPHRLLTTDTSPRSSDKNNTPFRSHCRDVSIKLDSFCRL